MPDREKVLKGLKCHQIDKDHRINCSECPYHCDEFMNGLTELHNDAIALLKENAPRETFVVIDTKTGEEADTYNIALHENWAKDLMYCDMEGWAIEDDGTLLLVDECGRYAYADRERFKVKWE